MSCVHNYTEQEVDEILQYTKTERVRAIETQCFNLDCDHCYGQDSLIWDSNKRKLEQMREIFARLQKLTKELSGIVQSLEECLTST